MPPETNIGYRGPITRQANDGSGNFEDVVLCDFPGRTIITKENGQFVEKTLVTQEYVPVSAVKSH